MNNLEVFKNDELGLSARMVANPDGSISVNAEDTAIGFGWFKTEIKNGKEYTSIRWERMNGFSAECGFAHEWSKDDYIPESLFYRLGMKASNPAADKFQNWLAMEVIPSIRKNGCYGKPLTTSEQIKLLAQGNMELGERIDKVENKITNLEEDMPLYGCEIDEIQKHVKKRGVDVLGGKHSEAYRDASIRGSVYSDIYRQIKREYGCVSSYKSIKRKYIADAHEFIDCYVAPVFLQEQIDSANAQMSMRDVV